MTDKIELPAPVDLKEGQIEIARIFLSVDADTGEHKSAYTIRDAFKTPQDWGNALAGLCEGLTERIMGGMSPIQSIFYDTDKLRRSGAVHALVAAIHSIEDGPSIAREVFGLEEDTAESSHEGALLIPSLIAEIAEAKQAITVWKIPDRECPGCGEVHPGVVLPIFDHSVLAPAEWGLLLGGLAAEIAAGFAQVDGGNQEDVYAKIVGGFTDAAIQRTQDVPHDGAEQPLGVKH